MRRSSETFYGVSIRESGTFAGTKNESAGLLCPSKAGASVGAKITGAITVCGTVDDGVGSIDASFCFAAVAVCFVGAVSSDSHGSVLQYSGLVGSEMGDRNSFYCLCHGGLGLKVPSISVPGHDSGVATVSTADAIVSSDGVNLSSADLHGFALAISDPV